MLGFTFLTEYETKVIFDENVSAKDVFYLSEILLRNLVVQSGYAFIHSSGILKDGIAYLFPGWGGAGKTNLLLHLLNKGAQLIGDDLVLVSEGGEVLPYPKPLNLLHYNFIAHKRILKNNIDGRMRRLIIATAFLEKCGAGMGKLSPWGRLLRKINGRIQNSIHRYIDVREIFGHYSFPRLKSINQYHVYYFINSYQSNVHQTEITSSEIADRMAACLRWERNYYSDILLAYEYAFPESRDFIRDLFDKEKTIIASATELAQSRVRVQFIIGYQASELSCALGLE